MKMNVNISNEVRTAIGNNLLLWRLSLQLLLMACPIRKIFETALAVEAKVREFGARPATIAILNGELRVGLSREEIESFAKKSKSITKVSRRDIPVVTALKKDGATTVASTMFIAEMAGIRIFATGGIGGVHRGAEITMDISADLEELANTNIAVVCAGAKSIFGYRADFRIS